MTPPLLTLEEAAARLSAEIGATTLRAAVRAGRLAAIRIGGRYFVTRDDLDAWVETCRVRANPLDCGSPPPAATRPAACSNPRTGASGTDPGKSALARALTTCDQLARRSPPT